MMRLLDLYTRHGESLQSLGIKSAVLPLNIASEHGEIFIQAGMVILGGDIYKKLSQDKFELFYASWSYDKGSVTESVYEAIDYINYIREKGDDLYVDFVFKGCM